MQMTEFVYEWDANRGGWFPKVNTISGEKKFAVWWEGWGLGRPLATSLFSDLEICHAILLNVFGVGEAWELVAPVATAEYVCFLICDRLMKIS